MIILGIETSCDETSCAVVRDGCEVLALEIFSQIELHRKTGGVVPEVAAREHAVRMVPVLEACLKNAGVSICDIDAIAVTAGPGLLSSLLMGDVAANTLSLIFDKPIIPVHHIEGHLYANFLERSHEPGNTQTPQFPVAVLTVSGGHNELILWKNHGDYEFLGATRDDSAGEAFDKVARLLGLDYPGGPAIEKAAHNGDPNRYPLPRAWLDPWKPEKSGKEAVNFSFSFSGLKSAVSRLVQTHRSTDTRVLPPAFIADVAASFQEAVCDVLSTKLFEAVVRCSTELPVAEVHLTGGVSANTALREAIARKLNTLAHPPTFRHPEKLIYCTDNAAMIAAVGFAKWKKLGDRSFVHEAPVLPDPNLKIRNW